MKTQSKKEKFISIISKKVIRQLKFFWMSSGHKNQEELMQYNVCCSYQCLTKLNLRLARVSFWLCSNFVIHLWATKGYTEPYIHERMTLIQIGSVWWTHLTEAWFSKNSATLLANLIHFKCILLDLSRI